MLFNFGNFSCKMSVYIYLGSNNVIFSNLNKNTWKNFKLKKRSKMNFFVIAPLPFLTKIFLNLFSVNDFFA